MDRRFNEEETEPQPASRPRLSLSFEMRLGFVLAVTAGIAAIAFLAAKTMAPSKALNAASNHAQR